MRAIINCSVRPVIRGQAGRKEEEGSEERKEGGESKQAHGAPALIAVYHSHRTMLMGEEKYKRKDEHNTISELLESKNP